LQQLTALETYYTNNFMTLDPYTRRNLELFETGRNGSVKGSLLWVLDHTRTPMGARLLRRWIGQPLLDTVSLQQRQETIGEMLEDTLLQARLAEGLKKTGDVERLANRIRQRIASPRDLVALANGLHAAMEIRTSLDEETSERKPALTRLMQRLTDTQDIVEQIEQAIVETPPLSINEGGIIRAGFNAELDQLKDASHNGRKWIAEMEQRERKRTGINNLKVGYNKATGYFIEVSKANMGRVPDDYMRRQTLTNCERYITSDLKEYETLILNAQDRLNKMENEFFVQLRTDIAINSSERILESAHALAEIDVYVSLAEVAAKNNYCCPRLDDSEHIEIVNGRHPVVEQAQDETPFIPNDAMLATDKAQITIITGPNMAGKSTYLRQVALIILLAQIGSYVPAERASIGLVDRIFTRIGAQDDLATGQSTFMVEMVETANILHHATPRSLIILDEIGRGTSTYDGLAIARAVVEYLHNNKRCGARTLFATHYHELVEVAQLLPRIRCMNVAVTEEAGNIIFLRKIVPGGADRSYGVHVAQLAGIPRPVVLRAKEILEELEKKGEVKTRRKVMRDMTMPAAWQMTLLGNEPNPVLDEIKQLAIDELTPIEALRKLHELQQKARKE
jgi:DNA mismatch repair protein MutS